jgi:hypothetical protein
VETMVESRRNRVAPQARCGIPVPTYRFMPL